MKLKVLGSSSSGNCYLLDDGEQILVIEAGLPFAEVKAAIDYKVHKIVGVLSSHEHGDHRKYLNEYISSGIHAIKGCIHCFLDYEYNHPVYKFGKFVIHAFGVVHDVPCYGYMIDHPDMGRLVFVTDTEYVKYTFPEVNHIMVETNYAQDILDENMNSGEIPPVLRNRIMKSHMSFDTAIKMVEVNKSPYLRNVIMCHLSTRNSDHRRFKDDMQKVAGPYCNVSVAKKGAEFILNKYPF